MNRRLRWSLIATAVVLVLMCAGGIYAVTWTVTRAKGLAEASNTVESYLHAIENENWDTAYEHLCAGYRARWSKDAYLQLQSEPQPDWTRHDIDDAPIRRTLNGKPAWRFKVRLHAAGGLTHDWVLDLIEEDANWKVCAPNLEVP
ncbi:MAG TPA: hypothetical protein VF062_28130 [Candidatus Limnocylindrales bacterium]